MRIYQGTRTAEGASVTRQSHEYANPQALPLRLDLWDHSPTGFEWGYGGSGPAQLSLALLADALSDEHKAVTLHQSFKWEVVARLPPQEAWQLTEEEIRTIAQQIENRRSEETGNG